MRKLLGDLQTKKIIASIKTSNVSFYVVHHHKRLLCKAKRQYLLTCKVSRYCISALHDRWPSSRAWNTLVIHGHRGRIEIFTLFLSVYFFFLLNDVTSHKHIKHCSALQSQNTAHRAWVAKQFANQLTLSILNLPLSSSSTTSRELLSQFSTCSGWRWLDVV